MRGWNAKSLKNRIREGEDERQKSCPDWRKTGRACSGRGPLQIFRDWVQKTEFLPVEARWLVAGYLSTWSVLGLLGRSNHFTQLRAAFRREWWGREMLSGKEADLALNRWALQLFSFGRWRKLHSPHDPFKGHDDDSYTHHGQQNPARGKNFPKNPFYPENKCFHGRSSWNGAFQGERYYNKTCQSFAFEVQLESGAEWKFVREWQEHENVGSRNCLSFTVSCKNSRRGS